MRIPQVFRSLISGSLLYVAIAACSEASDGASVGALSGADGGGGTDALIKQIANPVKDANADTLPPDVAVENCDKAGSLGSASNLLFAVHSYPGKTVEELSAVRVLGHVGANTSATIGGNVYEHSMSVQTTLVRAGSIAVLCGGSGSSAYDTVTFVSPR